jgi:hypothetical protein
MATRRSTAKHSIPNQAFDIAWATPLVMTLRIFQMATAGVAPSSKDRKEFDRMWSEKLMAYSESWAAMTTEWIRLQQESLPMLASCWLNPWAGFAYDSSHWNMHQPDHLSQRLLSQGLAPIHKRVTANAKRLSKGK